MYSGRSGDLMRAATAASASASTASSAAAAAGSARRSSPTRQVGERDTPQTQQPESGMQLKYSAAAKQGRYFGDTKTSRRNDISVSDITTMFSSVLSKLDGQLATHRRVEAVVLKEQRRFLLLSSASCLIPTSCWLRQPHGAATYGVICSLD